MGNGKMMKFLLGMAGLFFSSVVLAGPPPSTAFRVILDKDTGCQYLAISGAIVPRLTEHGGSFCGKEATPDVMLSALKAQIILDTGTGCTYVYHQDFKGATPQLDRNAMPVCMTKFNEGQGKI